MKKLIRELFFLRRAERRALIIVIFLLIIFLALRTWIAMMPAQNFEPDKDFVELVQNFQKEIALTKIEKSEPKKEARLAESISTTLNPFVFDPNRISADSLKLMNLSDFVIKNFIRYRNSGGVFKESADIKKIYGMDSIVYAKLLPFVLIDIQTVKSVSSLREVHPKEKIEINSADSTILMSIPGIGPSYSKRIIKYRDMLGGYYAIDQLWEVYGMDSIRYLAIEKNCSLDSSRLVRIEINKCTFSELISHPYISKADTYAILQFRDFLGRINQIEDLDFEQIIDHESFIRVRPYLFVSALQ